MDQPIQPSNTDIAVMNTNIQYIQRDISKISQDIKELSGVYATKAFVDDAVNIINLRFTGIDSDIAHLRRASLFEKWVNPFITAILTALFTFLVISYLGHK